MEQEIKNKVAVITGGAKGIGYAISEELLKGSASNVIILDVNSEQGYEAVQTLNTKYGENKAEFIKCDVTKDLDETFNIIIDKYKTVDILVNNAGIGDESNTKRIFDINAIAVIEWSKKFLGHMRKDKGGKGGTILNISSVAGCETNPCYLPVYSATKHAVFGFSKTVGHAENYAVHGVRLVTLCPGCTNTDLYRQVVAQEGLVFRDIVADITKLELQEVGDVATAAAEVITKVATGTAWKIVGAKKIVQV